MKNSEIDSRLKELNHHHHCCNCGRINPEIGNYSGADAGFTLCCNEALCKGNHRYIFSDGDHCVEACCWAVAELQFRKAGVDISKMKEIRRTQLD